ncbi:MAG: M23 family metallopeptidase [Pseudomonadota bacterium]
MGRFYGSACVLAFGAFAMAACVAVTDPAGAPQASASRDTGPNPNAEAQKADLAESVASLNRNAVSNDPTAKAINALSSATDRNMAASPIRPVVHNGVVNPSSERLRRQAQFAEAMQSVQERQRVFTDMPADLELDGSFTQGGLIFGKTAPGSTVRLDGERVMLGPDGRFVVGFGRDSALTALLTVTSPDGRTARRALAIEDRTFPVSRIDGIDQSKVSGFTEKQLEKIAADRALKKKARVTTEQVPLWGVGFDWPVRGRISGVFGSQRILNGVPKRPHSGLDIARPTGTPIKAPADGVVTLANSDMYFEGGLVLIDHGLWLETAYLHMSRIDVQPGQRVSRGDVIGAVGATGRVTGPHLHWSVKWRGRLVDPLLLVEDKNAPS